MSLINNSSTKNKILWGLFIGVCIPVLMSIIIGLLPLALTIVPFILGIKTLYTQLIYQKQTSAAMHNPEYAKEFYDYTPDPKAIWQKLGDFIKMTAKITLLPLYIWGRGLQTLLAMVIYPTSNEKSNPKKYPKNKISVNMPGNIQLFTLEYAHDNNYSKNKPHILYLGGNGARFENYSGKMQADAKEHNAVSIGFHHSSFGNSGRLMSDGSRSPVPTTSTTMLVNEGIAQVQRLLDKGVKPGKIILYGHSLGGGLATLIVAHFHKKNIRINLFNDRSFSNITNTAVGFLLPNTSKHLLLPISTTIKHALQTAATYALKPLVKLILYVADWDINAGAAYKHIGAAQKDYVVARYVSKILHKIIATDEVIHHTASLHNSIKKTETTKVARKGHKFFDTTGQHNHCNTLNVLGGKANTQLSGTKYFNDFVTRTTMAHG